MWWNRNSGREKSLTKQKYKGKNVTDEVQVRYAPGAVGLPSTNLDAFMYTASRGLDCEVSGERSRGVEVQMR
jgi:hypothetical protein